MCFFLSGIDANNGLKFKRGLKGLFLEVGF